MNKITIFARSGYCRDLRLQHGNKGVFKEFVDAKTLVKIGGVAEVGQETVKVSYALSGADDQLY